MKLFGKDMNRQEFYRYFGDVSQVGGVKSYTLNSQKTIREKTQYVCENGFGGIMSWDLATDVDVTHEMSLLKVVKEEFNYYANPTVE